MNLTPANGLPLLVGRLAITPSVLPLTLPASIYSQAIADPALAMVDGGIWRDELPAGKTPTIYAIFSRSGSSEFYRSNTSAWQSEIIRFRIFSNDPDVTEMTGQQLADAIRKWPSLPFQTGYSIPPIEVGAMSAPVRGRVSGARDSWTSEVTFNFRCLRGAT